LQALAITASAASTGETARGHAVDRDQANIEFRVPGARTYTATITAARRGEILHVRVMIGETVVHLADIHVQDGIIAHAGRPPETIAHKFIGPSLLCQSCQHHFAHPIHSPELIANLWRSTT